MKHWILIIALLTPALAHGQTKSVTIYSGPKPLDVVEDAIADYAVKAVGKHWQYRGPNTANGPFKLDRNGKYLRLLPVDANATATTRGKGLVNKPVQWNDVDVTHYVNDGLLRVVLTIKSAAADTVFTWRLDATDTPELQADGSVTVGEFTILPPWATDANGDSVAVDVALTGPVNGLYTYTKTVRHLGAVYPVTFDPSVTVTQGTAGDAWISYVNANHTTAINSDTGSVTATVIRFGEAGTYRIDRGFAALPLSTLSGDTMIVDSANFIINGNTDDSATDFWFTVYSSFHKSTVVKGNYSTFDGSPVVGGAATALTDSFSTANYSADDMTLHGTAALADTIQAHLGDTLFVIFRSHNDLNDIGVRANSTIAIDAGGDANPPELVIYYTKPLGISAATALTCSTIDVTYDTTACGTRLGANPDTIYTILQQGTDSVRATGYVLVGTDPLRDTVTVTDADSNYKLYAVFKTTAGTKIYGLQTQTARTHAAVPTLADSGWTQKTVKRTVQQGTNQLQTRIALACSVSTWNHRVWLTSTGDTTNADTAYIALTSLLSGLVTKMVFDTNQTIYCWATAKNRDSIITAATAKTAITTYGTLDLTMGFVDSTRLSYTVSFSNIPTGQTPTAAIYSSSANSDSAITDTFSIATAVTDTTPARGNTKVLTPNLRVPAVAGAILNGGDSVATSGTADTIWTDPLDDFTMSATAVNDTTIAVTVSIGNNPAYTLFGFIDSALVAAGSTNVWYSYSGGMSASAVKYDSTGFPDTLRWNVGTAVSYPDTAKVRLYWFSGDSLANGLK